MKTFKIKNREEFKDTFNIREGDLFFLKKNMENESQPEQDRILFERALKYLYPQKPLQVTIHKNEYLINIDETNYTYMLRETQGKIKYRVWIKDKMYYDIHRINFNTGEVWAGLSTPFRFGYLSNPGIVLMKSTNYPDIRGNLIWEGDIIKSNPDNTQERICMVSVDPYSGVYLYTYSSGAYDGEHLGRCVWSYDRNAVVIGNVLENPELLREFPGKGAGMFA